MNFIRSFRAGKDSALALGEMVERGRLPERLLGRTLSGVGLDELEALGADPRGENGAYHTVVPDGPLSRCPAAFEQGEIPRLGHISAVNITAKESGRGEASQ